MPRPARQLLHPLQIGPLVDPHLPCNQHSHEMILTRVPWPHVLGWPCSKRPSASQSHPSAALPPHISPPAPPDSAHAEASSSDPPAISCEFPGQIAAKSA